MRKFWKLADLFAFGAVAYCLCEVLWRGKTHWSMALLGGLMFLLIGLIDELSTYRLGIITQGILGGAIITAAELVSGYVLNIVLKLNIWDYSALPFNFLGQICLMYSTFWVVLSIVAVLADNWIRHLAWGEKIPRYKLF